MRPLFMALVTLAALLSMAVAARAEVAPPPVTGPDPLAPLTGMIGSWKGTGTSAFGAFSAEWEATRQGAWLLSTSRIFDLKGNLAETVTQMFGANPDGTFSCYSFDSGGLTVWQGTADAKGGSFAYKHADNGSYGSFTWTMNTDGSMQSSLKMHSTVHPPGWPDDFWVEEIDHRVE